MPGERRQRLLLLIPILLFVTISTAPCGAQAFIRGDADGDGMVMGPNDIVAILDHIFFGIPVPPPSDRADVNDNELVTLTDALYLTAYLFCGAPPPPPPFPGAGLDPSNSMGGFGSVQAGYHVTFSAGTITPAQVEIVVTVDSVAPVSNVEFILELVPAITPQSPTFVPAPGVVPTGTSEILDGNLFFVGVLAEGCGAQLLPAGTGVPLGSLVFNQTGSIPACPAGLPLLWVPDTPVGGVNRRAAIVTTALDDMHPGATLIPCGPPTTFIRGDANGDGVVMSPNDILAILDHIFTGIPVPLPFDRADVNDNEFITLTDALYLTSYLFCPGAPPPPAPFPGVGPDPTSTTAGFGSVQPGYNVNLSVGNVTSGQVEIVVTVDSLDAVSNVELVLDLDPALTPQSPAFVPAPGLVPTGTSEIQDGSLFFVGVLAEGCSAQLLPAGNDVPLGSLFFNQNGSIPICPQALPVTWIPDIFVSGVQRRAVIVTTALEDMHPGVTTQPCTESFVRGDGNGDTTLGNQDLIYLVNYFFAGGPTPLQCDGTPLVDSGDTNDNEWITYADILLLSDYLFVGTVAIPPPLSCGGDPSQSQGGFNVVDPTYNVTAFLELTLQKVEVHLGISVPPGTPPKAATVVVEYDPALLTVQNPAFCPGPNVTLIDDRVDGNRVIITVGGPPGGALPSPDPATNQIDLGTLHLLHGGGVICGMPLVSLQPEHLIGAITYRATIVDALYADHHPLLLPPGCKDETKSFIRGDGNGDGVVNIADPVWNLNFLFQGGPSLCLDAQDSNDDGMVNIADPIYGLDFQFNSGPPPPPPPPLGFPSTCGPDPTLDDPCNELGCNTYPNPVTGFVCP